VIVRKKYSKVFRTLILAVVLLWSGLPILLVLMSSVKDPKTIFESPPRFIFRPTLYNYSELIGTRPDFFLALINSVIVTFGATLIVIVCATLAGYAFSRYRSTFFTTSAFSMLAIRLLPPIVATIPLFYWINNMGLQDNHFTLSFIYASFFISLGTWIMKCFMDTIPRELEEAAVVDGASTIQLLLIIIVPLSVHGIITISIFTVIYAWKEYLWASILTSLQAKTAPVIIADMQGALMGVDWGLVFAAVAIQYLPLAFFILFMQRFIVRGITIGAVKG
jgi:multiple sugar transport system permease protein